MRIHIVKKGDTLWKIAKEYGVDFEQLKQINSHLANPDILYPGMEIYLPDTLDKKSTNSGQMQSANQKNSKEMLTRPIDEFILPNEALQMAKQTEVKPMSKEQMTKPVEKALTKEQMTKPVEEKEKRIEPIKEVKPPKEVEKKIKPIELKPSITPQFHFDFSPQIHHQPKTVQPQNLPQPIPQMQPIFIEMPQAQQPPIHIEMPKTEQPPIHIEMPKAEQPPIYIEMPQAQQPPIFIEMPPQQPAEHIKEYIPIQQPHYVYIPYFLGYIPCPEPMPPIEHCSCQKMEHPLPCSCENTQYSMPQPMMPQIPAIAPHMYEQDSSDYVAPQIDLQKVEEGLPDWIECDSSSTPDGRGKKQIVDSSSYNESTSATYNQKKKRKTGSHPYMNPNPYKPWNC